MAASSFATSLRNGQRAVVVLFISRILYSLPPFLLSHGVSLSVLALSSSFGSSISPFPFRTRPGASSGILLGAVTLHSLLLSKLVQLSRGFSFAHVQLQELHYLTLQYWATSATAFSFLLFLALARSRWGVRFGFCFVFFLQAVVCIVALSAASQTGSAIKLPWVFFHGLAAVKLLQHFLRTFPSCASIGEAFLATASIILYFGDILLLTITKLCRLLVSSELITAEYKISCSEISIIIQGLVLGLLLYPVALKYILQIWEWSISKSSTESRRYNEIGRSLMFIATFGFVLIVVVPSWMQFVQEFHFYNISKNSKIERILLRKYYHLMAVLMFLPALIFQPKFLDLAFGTALVVFLTLEIVQVWRIWPLERPIHQCMNAFTDHRDSDLLIGILCMVHKSYIWFPFMMKSPLLSHFSLLLGCALPIWMSSGYNDRPLAPFAGILSLGIVDTKASMVGHKYGVLRWSKTDKKTIEGTAAGIMSVPAACSSLLPLLASTGYILTQHWFSLLLAVTVSGLLEAYTAQLDNAFMPLSFYSLLCL